MTLKVVKKLCPKNKYGRKCPYKMAPEYLTIHNTESDASAKNEINYMLSNNNQVSYHYAVDDKQAIQAIPLNRNAWHAGDGNGPGNRKSIGIEICYSKSGGSRFDQAEENAAYLAAVLLKKYGWGISRVKRHKDWSGKECPRRTMKKGWNRFLNMIQKELDELNGKSPGSTAPKPAPVKYIVNEDVRSLQKALNKSYGCGLKEDSSFGPASQKQTEKHYLYYRKSKPIKNAHVKWYQKQLNKKFQAMGRKERVKVDGSFGPDCKKKTELYQKLKGLKVDGCAGPDTHRSLLK